MLCGLAVFAVGWVLAICLMGWFWGLLLGWWPAALVASFTAWLMASWRRAAEAEPVGPDQG